MAAKAEELPLNTGPINMIVVRISHSDPKWWENWDQDKKSWRYPSREDPVMYFLKKTYIFKGFIFFPNVDLSHTESIQFPLRDRLLLGTNAKYSTSFTIIAWFSILLHKHVKMCAHDLLSVIRQRERGRGREWEWEGERERERDGRGS